MSWIKIRNGKYDWPYDGKKMENTNLSLLEKFINENNIVATCRGRSKTPIRRFLETGKDNGSDNSYTETMHRIGEKDDHLKDHLEDHDCYFKTDTGSCIYVSFPYRRKENVEQYLKEFSILHGIKAEVHDGSYSWHAIDRGDNLCFIVLSLPNSDIKIFKNDIKYERKHEK